MMYSKLIQKLANSMFVLSGVFTVAILLVIISFILINGLEVLDFEFIFAMPLDSGKNGGIFPMILSTIYLLIVTAIVAIPIGVGSAVYVSEYSSNNMFANAIRFISQVLSSIPSIIFGLFGLAFLVFFLKLGWSILTGGIVLALMAIPTIFQVSEVSIKSIPQFYRESCYALGASKWQCISSVLLPIALPGIFTGIILAITRAISEAAAVMYVVGSSIDVPMSVLDSGRPLPLHLFILVSEGISMNNAFGTAAVLVIFVIIITVFSNYAINNYQKNVLGC